MLRGHIRVTVLLVAALASIPTTVAIAAEVNLYSARKEKLIKPLLDRFTKETGITVNLLTGKADALLKRLQAEGANSRADVFITVDVGRLHRARVAGVLQPIKTPALSQAVPQSYRDPDGYWYGLSVRARPIMYVKSRVKPSELSTYEDLGNAKWKGRICSRSSNNIYNQSLVASMIIANGEARVEIWAKKLVANFARSPKGGDRDQIKAAAAGQCDIAIANTYYLGAMLTGKDEAQRQAAEKLAIFWPNQNERGVHVNVSGAGITKSAKHKQNAIRLLEFLVSDSAQQWYAEANNEYPVRPGVARSATVRAWGDFKADSLGLAELGKYNASALKLMDRAGWK